jgi:hypothetical protein
VKREEREAVKTTVQLAEGLRAPLAAGQTVGTLVVRSGDRPLAQAALVAPGPVDRSTFWWLTPWK